MENIYSSLILIKPDAFRRGLVGKIFDRFENFILEHERYARPWIDRARIFYPDVTTIKRLEMHYIDHKDKIFYNDLIAFMMSGSIMALRMRHCYPIIADIRKFVGATDPKMALPNTIRGDFGDKDINNPVRCNLVHASDSEFSAERELMIWGLHV